MTKQHNWPTALHRLIIDNQNTPFAWGTFDCCTFAADAVKAQTGIDPDEPYRGKYSTSAGALKIMKQSGAGDIESTMRQQLGEPVDVSPSRGDICLFEGENGPTAGVYASGVIWSPGEKGLVAHRNPNVLHVWRIE